MSKVKRLLYMFVCVTACVDFVTAAYISVFWPNAALGVELLWEILFVSFLCCLPGFMYADTDEEVSKKKMRIEILIHYLEVNVVVLGCGLWFGWFYADNLLMVLGMVIVIALVFLLVSFVTWKREENMAVLLNERLEKYQKDTDIE